ncbi:bifunctional diguanylate cyclase/phosphodiesterase [Asanoa sp. WMMD1127]|uniref:putative bifunctional diguanylate cyclase/phosphodiesterase n=1 Tax=Asanoa sp. WMMD1127 TaxID=3016107 RepID=UPI0024174275|nr:bifunctional diguanylate cyclase/phosphodiesterase [Asanoa sp. WMMD1127]MDG4822128.1 bifunctional diguanylate cyclase/phosphodiesterase [Asanoa sp. WMMD1127]
MTDEPKTHHNATDRQLRLLVGLVVFLAAVAIAASIYMIATKRVENPSLLTLGALTVAATASNRAMLNVRIRANKYGQSWTEIVTLVGLTVAPPPWVVVCTAVGIVIGRVLGRVSPLKVAFGASKDAVSAAAGAGVMYAGGTAFVTGDPQFHILSLVLAFLTVTVVDELLVHPVVALATRTPLSQQFRRYLDIRIGFGLARLVVALFIVWLLSLNRDAQVLLVAPLLILTLHLWYSNRIRKRDERISWQRLASSAEALNDVDLRRVMEVAVEWTPDLFSADGAEVEVFHTDPPRLVRGLGGKVDPPGAGEWPTDTFVITTVLEDRTDSKPIGELRLHFSGPVQLNEMEIYKLRTFASALNTAIHNASAYAELERVAVVHAHDAAHDALTGLANRRQLLDHGQRLISDEHANGVVALLLLDLNHFKEVNDTLGHAAGDEVLKQVAQRLGGAARTDDLVARLGGDEFAVLLTGLPAPAVAAHRAERLIRALQEPMEVEGMQITVEASGGIATAPSTGGIAELLRRADVAMYQAKRSGLRIATYSHARDTADIGRFAMTGGLTSAVADGTLTVDFQPIVDLASGEVLAAEALARWHHPDHGTVDPLRFLETVERSGLLPAFAEAVLDQALLACSSWREAGFDLPVAVNVAPRSLLDPRFPGSVTTRLRTHDLPPDRLILELTETLTISQLEVVDQVLGRLRDEGVRLALDDFGTGYSSLSVLSRIPVHELKIDKQFVTAMETSPEAGAVIRSTVDLGRSLDLAVVAEGVDSEPQRRALWELGCTAGQGQLFARPMTAARLLASLHRGSGGRPGTLAPALHDEGAVIRLSPRRAVPRQRSERLPHLGG